MQSDTEETGSRVEDGQAEEVGENSKGGRGGGSKEIKEAEGLSGQGRVWKDWWQRTRNKKVGARVGDEDHDIEEREVTGARMWGADGFEEGEAVEEGKI